MWCIQGLCIYVCPVRCWLGTVRELHKPLIADARPVREGSVSCSIGAGNRKLDQERDGDRHAG